MNCKKKYDSEFLRVLFLSTINLIIAIILIGFLKNICFNKNQPINGLYTKVLHYTIPTMKLSSVIEYEDNDKFSFKEMLSKAIKLNSGKYLSVVGREISYLKVEKKISDDTLVDPENSIDKFTLNEDQVYELENEVNNKADMSSVQVFNPKLKKEASIKPEVLIYHTHTCESYKPNGSSCADLNKNIAAVGDELKKELEKYGITTIHDKTIHDLESYNDSYTRSRATLKKYLNEYKDFKLIIDLHRDSIENKDKVTTTINGENVARFSFVMTKNHPNSYKNIKLSETLAEISNKFYPGDKDNGINSFYKGAFYYEHGKQFYSQDLNSNVVLMEVGSQVNTLSEAKASAKYIARIIAEYINGKN